MTSDPLVATLFAIECLQHGPAVVLLVPRQPLQESIATPNHFATYEAEVVVNLPPSEVARLGEGAIDAQSARDILVALGFDQIPVRIAGKGALREAINHSYIESQRLSPLQILEFDRRVLESLR